MFHDLIVVLMQWLLQYGAPILFLMLVLGIVGLPIPDETLLTLAGWLIAKGKFDPFPMIIAAISGSICGISLSYWLGRLTGPWFMKKYGPKVRISEEKMLKVHNLYDKYGKWLLFVGYFIPLVRHLSGYIAGCSKLNIRDFMLFAYTGAVIWALTFLSLGYFLLIQVFPVSLE